MQNKQKNGDENKKKTGDSKSKVEAKIANTKTKKKPIKNSERANKQEKTKSIFSRVGFWVALAGIAIVIVAINLLWIEVVSPDQATSSIQLRQEARQGTPSNFNLVFDKNVSFSKGEVVWIVDGVEQKRGSATQKSSFELEHTFDGVGKHVVRGEVEGFANLTVEKEIDVKKPLLVLQVKEEQRVYGQENPVPSYTISGFIDSDNEETVKLPQLQFDAEQNASVGEYGVKQIEHAKYDVVAKGGKLKISPKPVDIGVKNAVKTYDGTTSLSDATFFIKEVVGGDEVFVKISSASYDDKSVGKDKKVKISEGMLYGKDAKNYCLSHGEVTGGEIIAKKITVSGLKPADKIFDGSTSVTFENIGKFEGVAKDDEVEIGRIVARFDSPVAGKQKRVVIDDILLEGKDAKNYIAEIPQNLVANINDKK